jgi:TPR repeat protein
MPGGQAPSVTADMDVGALRLLADGGNADAQYVLGLRYESGTGVEADGTQAVTWFRQAADQGHPDAQFSLGIIYATGLGVGVSQDLDLAAEWWRRAANQGHPAAQANLGLMYASGQGVAQDPGQAVAWYRKAANQGLAEAQFAMGVAYASGVGVAQDFAQAMIWYRQAADQESASARYSIGVMYANGEGVNADLSRAITWLRPAAEQGLVDAQHALGAIYEGGNSAIRDLTQAAAWYRRAANQGHPVAQASLGVMYDLGQGVEPDPVSKQRFRRLLQVFLGEKRITGVKVKADTVTRVLVAASAIIPVFGFPDWEWNQINEVLVYPNRFDGEFQFGDARGQNILGMVGTGSLSGLMILSKPDLIDGFRNTGDKRNVGVHEFAHLVDKTDGVIDGVPEVGLGRQAIEPWLDLMRRKMAEIEKGNSDINRYALTNEAEFFAVTSEYFFERPGIMQRKHPALYAALERVFNQDARALAVAVQRELTQGRPVFGRNSPCPCGSGRKFKKCCRE